MLDECRIYYHRNKGMLKKIDHFEKSHTPDQVISYYTQGSFIFQIVNRALRTQNIEIIV
jgi:hypothetical protein